jgi:hypothetical protein
MKHTFLKTGRFAKPVVMMALAFLVLMTVSGAAPVSSNIVTVTNNYTCSVTTQLNFESGNYQSVTLDAGTAVQIDIGSEALVSLTIWSQTVPSGQNVTVIDPDGKTMSIYGYGYDESYAFHT